MKKMEPYTLSPPKQKPGQSKSDYSTPKEFLQAVRNLLNIEDFSIDLAASADNKVCDKFIDEETSSLDETVSWESDGWNWLNPPYGHITPWVEKAKLEALRCNARTAVLVPASVGSNWWWNHVHFRATVLFLKGRLTFVGHTTPYPKDCVLLLYDEQNTHGIGPFYLMWDWRKAIEPK